LSRHCSTTSKVSARYAQITFGHTHISTTQQIYTYFNEAASRDAAAMAHVTESNYRPSPYHGTHQQRRDQARRSEKGRPGRVSGMIERAEPI
jgi:hypothetical protein